MQILIDLQHYEYFREVILGARHYGFASKRFVFVDQWLAHELKGDLPALARRDGVQGIVAALHSPEAERRFAALPVPVVNVSNTAPEAMIPWLPRVTQDDEAVGRLAAGHLLACGCRTLGFWGERDGCYSIQRLEGFRAALAAEQQRAPQVVVTHQTKWSYPRVRAWLAAMARPVGIFAVLDPFALTLIRAARELGWRVPEDVAVLGAANDKFLVEFESVSLSSVRLPAKRIGYEAAAMLDRLIARGSTKAPQTVHLPVNEIAMRRSTDILHVDDPAVAKAALYIRTHATENPYVADIARAAGVSLSSLQSRFQAVIGRSLIAEVRRVRLARAQELLADTELPMSLVAERCGFPNSQQFSVLFREGTGTTPRAYRRRFRGEFSGTGGKSS